MGLYDVLVLASAGSAFGGGLAAAEVAGQSGNLLVIALNVVVAIACVVTVWAVGRRVIQKYYRLPADGDLSKSETAVLHALYVGTAAWVVVSGFLGHQLVAIAIRITS